MSALCGRHSRVNAHAEPDPQLLRDQLSTLREKIDSNRKCYERLSMVINFYYQIQFSLVDKTKKTVETIIYDYLYYILFIIHIMNTLFIII